MFYPQSRREEGPSSGHTVVKKHILQVSTHQMAVLILFNKRPVYSFQVNGCGQGVGVAISGCGM